MMSSSRKRIVRWFWIVCYSAAGCCACRAADGDEIVRRATAALNEDWAADVSYACVEEDGVQKGDRRTSKTFQTVLIDGSEYDLPLAVNDQPVPADRRLAELKKLEHEVQRREHESARAREERIEA